MTYRETLDYLFSRLPMYQRLGKAAYKADLKSTIELCAALGNPENDFRSVHVAGTNGKGSTSHMLASVFQEAGYKTGLYTSPHLRDFRERVRLNGEMIPEGEVIRFVEDYKDRFEAIEPSFFEWTVGLAFHYFSREKVDIAIIETGMGGRLDSTNVIRPEVSVITNIGHDHMAFLGDTLEKVAGEKAGIIKADTPVVIGQTQPDIAHVFEQVAGQNNTRIVFADQAKDLPSYSTDLRGNYQRHNIQTALMTIRELQAQGWKLEAKHIEAGLANVALNTGFLGRWQVLSQQPLTVADTAHNEEGLNEVLEQVKRTPHQNLHIVLGLVNDKNAENILKMFPKEAFYYFCQADIPRAMDRLQLQEIAAQSGLKGETYSSVANALQAAKEKAGKNDLIFVGGSTFVVAEVV